MINSPYVMDLWKYAFILPFRQGGVESDSFMGALWCTVDPPNSRPTSSEVMVGAAAKIVKEEKKALQQNGDLHVVEHMEGKKQENF